MIRHQSTTSSRFNDFVDSTSEAGSKSDDDLSKLQEIGVKGLQILRRGIVARPATSLAIGFVAGGLVAWLTSKRN